MIIRFLGVVVSIIFLLAAPLLLIGLEGWNKLGALPPAVFGVIFLVYGTKGKKANKKS
jgi:hypothetical protein